MAMRHDGRHSPVAPGLLTEFVGDALATAQASGGPRLASVVAAIDDLDPLDVFDAAAGGDRFYWCRPAADLAMASSGAAALIEAKGGSRFAEIDDAIASAFAGMHVLRLEGAGATAPRFVGGFGFEDESTASEWQAFPPARFVLPEVLVQRTGAGTVAVVSRCILPDDDLESLCCDFADRFAQLGATAPPEAAGLEAGPIPTDWGPGSRYAVTADRPHTVYEGQVAAALRAIGNGLLDKVVLARSLEVRHPGRFALGSFLRSLRQTYPSCTTLAVGVGDDTLVAASPELLVRRVGPAVETSAIAGSAPRGRTPEEDEALGRALLDNAKEQAEHAAVVDTIRDALAEDCGALTGPESPELLRVEGIQHLATPMSGTLRSGESPPSVVGLVSRLHPTPAVGGLPHGGAREFIARREGMDRGWYAGPVGFVDANADGEFWVALRSALVRNASASDEAPESVARLFAGAGIVAGSEPARELVETRLKLRALLAPLTEI